MTDDKSLSWLFHVMSCCMTTLTGIFIYTVKKQHPSLTKCWCQWCNRIKQ